MNTHVPRQARLPVAAPETRLTEWVNLGAAAWWTLLLLLPAHLFATQPTFAPLAALAPERHWALWTGLAALLGACGLVTGRPAWRVLGLAASAALWGFVAPLLGQAAPRCCSGGGGGVVPVNTGVGIYGAVGLADVACALLLSAHLVADLYAALWRLGAVRPGVTARPECPARPEGPESEG